MAYELTAKRADETMDDVAPIRHDQEWANALTHTLAAIAGLVGAILMGMTTSEQSIAKTIACLAFVGSAIAVFVASALSHYFIHDAAVIKRLRAWDQGLIYVMITGTYTPLVYQYASPAMRTVVLALIWIAAIAGFYSKVIAEHRVNGIGTFSYLALGWLPALFLVGRVPVPVLFWMATGGVLYTVGVAVLMNDHRIRYLHAVWHLLVMAAASCHYWAIYCYVATAA